MVVDKSDRYKNAMHAISFSEKSFNSFKILYCLDFFFRLGEATYFIIFLPMKCVLNEIYFSYTLFFYTWTFGIWHLVIYILFHEVYCKGKEIE